MLHRPRRSVKSKLLPPKVVFPKGKENESDEPQQEENKDDYDRGIFHPNRQIYSIADIHGDYELFIVQMTQVCCVATYDDEKKEWKWIGGNSLIVCLGDFFDRKRWNGPYSGVETGEIINEEAIIFKSRHILHQLAIKHGGGVLSCFGNHDLIQIYSGFETTVSKYTSDTELKSYHPTNLQGKRLAWQCNGKYHYLLTSAGLYGLVRVGDWLFQHAGLTVSNLTPIKDRVMKESDWLTPGSWFQSTHKLYDLIDVINFVTRLYMTYEECPNDKELLEILTSKKHQTCYEILKTLLIEDTDHGVYWDRTYSNDTQWGQNPQMCKELNDMFHFPSLSTVKLNRLVVGHSAQVDAGMESSNPIENQFVTYSTVMKNEPTRYILSGVSKTITWNVNQWLEVFPSLNWDCHGTIFRCDNYASRMADMKDVLEQIEEVVKPKSISRFTTALQSYFWARRPRALQIINQGSEWCIAVSKNGLTRPWFQGYVSELIPGHSPELIQARDQLMTCIQNHLPADVNVKVPGSVINHHACGDLFR